MSQVQDDLFGISYFVKRLEEARKHGDRFTLVLGSRTSAFYRSNDFYGELKMFAREDFAKKTRIQQFQSCYDVLNREDGLGDLHDVDRFLSRILDKMSWQPTDLYLAALIKQGLFGTVISTSIDNFLKEALSVIGIPEEEITEYNGASEKQELEPQKSSRHLLINVFGKIGTNNYSVRRENYFARRRNLEQVIRQETEKDTLVIGYDPVWDEGLGSLFSTHSKAMFWYINEEEPKPDPFFNALKERRPVPYEGIHANHTYEYFVNNLFKFYGGKFSAHYITQDFIFQKILDVERLQQKFMLQKNRDVERLQQEIQSLKDEMRNLPPRQ